MKDASEQNIRTPLSTSVGADPLNGSEGDIAEPARTHNYIPSGKEPGAANREQQSLEVAWANMRLFEKAMEQAQDAVLITEAEPVDDPGPRILYVNDTFQRMTGYTPEEVIGRTPRMLQGPNSDRAALDRMRKALKSWQPVREELINYRKDGTEFYVDLSIFPIADERGWYTHWISIQRETTEQNILRHKLEQSETHLRALHESLPHLIWTADPAGQYRSVSQSYVDFVGDSAENCLGDSWKIRLHPEDRASVLSNWSKATAEGNDFVAEYRLLRHDGQFVWFWNRATPRRDAAGRIVEWIGTSTDITNQKETENALRQSQTSFEKLFVSGLVGIAFPDRFGGFSAGNDEFLRIVGHTREELNAGMVRWDRMTPPEYLAVDAMHIAEAAQRGSCTPYEKEYIRKDGTRVPILVGYTLLEGTSDKYIALILDLSPQKKAEAALREREERFRALAESLPQLVWSTDVHGENEYCNQHYLDYAGVAADNLKGSAWWDLVHPDDRLATAENWQHALATGEPYLSEYRLRRHDGEYRYFLARGVPVRDPAGKIQYWIGSCTDVHDQKLVHEAMRRSEKLATAGRLAATIAHEINNPLSSVSNALYLALNDPSLSGPTRQYLKLAEQELGRISHFTTQTLRLHQQPSAPAVADVTKIMDSVFTVFGPRFDSASVTLTREYLTQEKLYCYSDELRQAFASMISNSLDATSSGDRLRVRIRKARAWSNAETLGIRVIIADTGEGISPRVRKTLFEPFISTRDATGTGLGLWVTERIVQKHHGTITFRSRTGEKHGTVFSLFFPFVGVAQ